VDSLSAIDFRRSHPLVLQSGDGEANLEQKCGEKGFCRVNFIMLMSFHKMIRREKISSFDINYKMKH